MTLALAALVLTVLLLRLRARRRRLGGSAVPMTVRIRDVDPGVRHRWKGSRGNP